MKDSAEFSDAEKPDWKTESYAAPNRGKAWMSFIGFILIVSVALVTFVSVPALMLNSSLNSFSNFWDSMAADVNPDAPLPVPSVMLDSNGQEFARLYVQNRIPVTFDEIPSQAVDALVAAEDKNFWINKGFSWDGLLRALYYNITSGTVVAGGSGITQQYVKNLLIIEAKTSKEIKAASETTLNRKIVEASTAVKLEKKLSKQEILTNYFNTVYFGNNAYGIGAASSYYFSKKPKDLTLGEIAILIASVQSPDKVNPINDMANVSKRKVYVLDRMVSDGYISDYERDAAVNQKLVVKITKPSNGCPASKYAFYCEWVKNYVLESPMYGETVEEREKVLYQGGLVIQTGLNPAVQDAADAANRNGIPASSSFSSASATVEPGTGRILALSTNKIFGQDENETEIVLPTVDTLHPGGSVKIATMAAALEEGWNVNTSMYAPETYSGDANVEGTPAGDFVMSTALNSNSDVWFAKLQEKIGSVKIANIASKMGWKSLPLGEVKKAASVLNFDKYTASVLEVANMYATVAGHGMSCTPVGIVSIVDSSNHSLPAPDADCQQVLSVSTADTLTSLLAANMVSGNGVNGNLGDRPSAGLANTSSNFGSIWFNGFIPQFASSVWMGSMKDEEANPVKSLEAFGQVWSPAYGSGAPAVLWKSLTSSGSANMSVVGFNPGGGQVSVGVVSLIPDVKGMNKSQGVKILEDAGYSVTVLISDQKDAKFNSGVILSQTPTSGSIVDAGNMKATVIVNK